MSSSAEEVLIGVPTEVWSLVAHYLPIQDVVQRLGMLSYEIHSLFDKENDEFWMYILKRDGYEYETGSPPFTRYTELVSKVLCLLPFERVANQNAKSKEVQKILLISTHFPTLTFRLTEWLEVRILKELTI
jgi:hypothetical protein